MTAYFLDIVPEDVSFVPAVESQRKACDFLADVLPYRNGRWRGKGSIEDFPSVGDIDVNEHPEEALANPHYVDQSRFSITIENHRELLTDAEFAQLAALLGCSLKQKVCEY